MSDCSIASKAVRIAAIFLTLIVCHSCVSFVPITPEMEKRFVGHYRAVLTGNRQVVLTIHEDLSYDYVEDSYRRGHVAQVFRSGTLRATGEQTARVGLVQLEWIYPGNVKALSPYGGSRRPNSTAGLGTGRGGMIYSDGSHVFFLRRR
ncbi:MAG: hypothetical protein OXC80_10740 [Gammaproteobacteria bacterium]|nr:hypothetical protein [Gammaproteobacteria bacterium]